MKFSDEPAVWIGFFQVAITATITLFGIPLSIEQIGAITLVLQTASTLFIRSQVTPVGKLDH